MSALSVAFALSALVSASGPATSAAVTPSPSAPASLTFVSNGQLLVGTVYGISAIDAKAQVYGRHLSANVPAGRRTVWYSCPNALQMSKGSSLSFDFVAGKQYELVCQPAQQAMIRATDDC
jgi:hypothetical protein